MENKLIEYFLANYADGDTEEELAAHTLSGPYALEAAIDVARESRLQYQKELVERIEEMKLPGESDGISITDYRHNSILNNVLEILKDPK